MLSVAKILKDGRMHWRCVSKNKTKCVAKLYTPPDDLKSILNPFLNRNHCPEQILENKILEYNWNAAEILYLQ